MTSCAGIRPPRLASTYDVDILTGVLVLGVDGADRDAQRQLAVSPRSSADGNSDDGPPAVGHRTVAG